MKYLALSLLLVTSVTANAAVGTTYVGTASWRKSSGYSAPRPQFSDLEQLGVERSAEKAALQKCAMDGNTGCAVTSVNITTCNQYLPGGVPGSPDIGCSAQATAIAF